MLFKHVVKTIAKQHGLRATFMPKPYIAEAGNGMHIHQSLRGEDGSAVFADGHGFSRNFESFIAGQLACLREFTLFFAPNINSYKRYAKGSFAPDVRRSGAVTTNIWN